MKTYKSFGALARELTRAAARVELTYTESMLATAVAVQEDAKERIGHYQEGWERLKPDTVREKTRLGYAGVDLTGGDGGDNPLLRTGEMRDSIEATATPRSFVVGSNNEILKYQEFGTKTIPPRPVLSAALWHIAPFAFKRLVVSITNAITGKK